MSKLERKEIFRAFLVPVLFFLVMWTVKLIELQFGCSFIEFGVFPQTLRGLRGVVLSSFIHKDITHLVNNSLPILILGGLLFSVYRKIALHRS